MIIKAPTKTFLSYKMQFFIIAGVWFLLHALLIKQFGLVTTFEAAKYVEQAQALLTNGSYISNNFIFYSTEILSIAVCLKFGISLWFVALLQLLVNGLSLFVFFRIIEALTKKNFIAFLTTLFLTGMYYYQLYNVHLFTESFFFSFTIFFTNYLFSCKKLNLKFLLLLLLGLLVLIFTRPTGLLFLPATFFYLIFRFGRKKALQIFGLTVLAGLTAFYFSLNAALNSGGEFDFLLPYTEEHIICGVRTASKPNAIALPVNKNSVEGLWHIITENSALFIRLAKHRLMAFWGVQRPYYSFGHNLFVAFYFYSLYFFILIGLKKLSRQFLAHTIFLLTYVFLVTCTVVLSCDEWHNRFLYSILPILLLLGTGFFIKKPVNNS